MAQVVEATLVETFINNVGFTKIIKFEQYK